MPAGPQRAVPGSVLRRRTRTSTRSNHAPATASSPAAVTGPSPGAGAASQARTASASSPPAGSPVARTGVKHFDFLNGVSCTSPANCTAVGQYYRAASGPQLTLVERWNGRAWRVEPSPSIGGAAPWTACRAPAPPAAPPWARSSSAGAGRSSCGPARSSAFPARLRARAWPSASRPCVDAAPDAGPAAAATIRPAGRPVVHRARRMRRGRKRRPHARRDLGRRALADHTHPQSVGPSQQPGARRFRRPAGRLRRARQHLGRASRLAQAFGSCSCRRWMSLTPFSFKCARIGNV